MADKSVEKPNLDLEPDSYNFIKKFIGCTDNDDFITLDSWVNSSGVNSGDLLLQMDIEGAEFAALINISNALLKRFRVLVFEFHHLDEFWNPRFFNVAELAFNKLLETHTCVHIHPNNCCGTETKFGLEIPKMAEFTFLRNDRIKSREFATTFPHPLDVDNEGKASLILPQCWYKKV
ncbi:MAG: methyltransferase [Sphingobacteriaceae bacterium]|nr:MAG: methyltransferase [Sphingobacteriaceae bacterium]